MDRNPQAKQMADESMVRNLAAQADAIWPQEEPIMRSHALPDAPRILDVGTGTGEIALRLAKLFPRATILGIDIIEAHLEIARRRATELGDRVTFAVADAFELPYTDASFDLVVCRHVLQAIPTPERVLAELVRVLRAGGVLHVIPEDYDMIHMGSRTDVSWFWHAAPRAFAAATNTDLHIGRNIFRHLRALPVERIRYDYVHVDTQRVPRETFASIFTAWRDGYVDDCAVHLAKPVEEIRAAFDATIDCIRDPDSYALWVVPVVTAIRK